MHLRGPKGLRSEWWQKPAKKSVQTNSQFTNKVDTVAALEESLALLFEFHSLTKQALMWGEEILTVVMLFNI